MYGVYRKGSDGWFNLCWMTVEGRDVACVFSNHAEATDYATALAESNEHANTYKVLFAYDLDMNSVRLCVRSAPTVIDGNP